MFSSNRFIENRPSTIKGCSVCWGGEGVYSATFSIWCFPDASNKGSLFMAFSVFTSLYHAVSANDMGWLGAESVIFFYFL